MLMLAIVAGLLLAVGGCVVLAALIVRLAAGHRADLHASGERLVTRLAGRRFADRGRGLRALGWKRLNPAGAFALSLALGLVIIALAAALLGTLAEDVTHGDGVAVLDHPVARFVTAHRSGALTSAMEAVSTAGGPATLAVIMLGAGLLLALTGRTWSPLLLLLLLAVSVAGSSGLTAVFKAVLGRARPPLAHAVTAADGYAFPSGHAATAAAALGVLACLCAVRIVSRQPASRSGLPPRCWPRWSASHGCIWACTG